MTDTKMNELVNKLNRYRDQYYNNNVSEISDFEYDKLYDELVELEKTTGIQLPNSPTKSVGFTVVSKLNKITHNHAMLSLDKTKEPSEIVKFAGGRKMVCMAKMDGLTCSILYRNHKFISAETRGDGMIGEDITHNAFVVDSIPKYIPTDGEVIIDGEIITCLDDFREMNLKIENIEDRYSHPRNYAAGSIRQLDSKIASQRKLKFVAWKAIKGTDKVSFTDRWEFIKSNNFIPVPITTMEIINNETDVNTMVSLIKSESSAKQYPIDGCVFAYDDTEYGKSLGETSHHVRDQMAFKFYDELFPSKLRAIEWTMGKTGVLTPTAIFNPVNIDSTSVSRASLHNVSIMENLKLKIGCTVYVYKANQIIPQIDSCEQDGNEDIQIPDTCPVCGSHTRIVKENNSEVLICTNTNCGGKRLAKFVNFVSRKGADIQGLSEATLNDLIYMGYLKDFADIYYLKNHASELSAIEGYGTRSVEKLLEAIENSRNIKLDKFISAVGIDGVGSSTAKVIAQQFDYDYDKFIEALNNKFDFTQINGFGDSINSSIYNWYSMGSENLCRGLSDEFTFIKNTTTTDNTLNGLRFCITGSFSKSRDELKAELEKRGAVFVSGVSKKLDILFVGAAAGSKLNKAQELGIKIGDEDYLMSLIGNGDTNTINMQDSDQITLW